MHKIDNHLAMPVHPKVAAPPRERLADAVDVMIELPDEVALGSGDVILQAGRRPVASPIPPMKLPTERANTPTQVLHEIHARYYAHSRWGINE